MWRWVLPVAAVAAVLIGFLASQNGPTGHVSSHAPPTTTTPPPANHRPAAWRRSAAAAPARATVRHVIWIWFGSQGVQPPDREGAGSRRTSTSWPASAAWRPGTRRSRIRRSQTTSGALGRRPARARPQLLRALHDDGRIAALAGATRGAPSSAGCRRPCRKLAAPRSGVLTALQPAHLSDGPRVPAVRPAARHDHAGQPAADARGKRPARVLADRARRLRGHLLQQALRRDAQAREVRRPRRPVAAQLDAARSRRRRPTSPARR